MWCSWMLADINDWLKGVIAFGHAKGHNVKDAAKYAAVWKHTVIRIHHQNQNFYVYRNGEQKETV